MMDFKVLRLEQLTDTLKGVRVPHRPPTGWIRAIRTTLGMTTRQLAERLGVGQSTALALEKSEADDRITLHSLRRAAEALDCELHYVLVPRRPLTETVEQRAKEAASQTVGSVLHTMRLEDQSLSDDHTRRMAAKEAENALTGRWSKLWER